METMNSLDAEETIAFTKGDCWALALDMHQRYNLPLCFVIASEAPMPVIDKEVWWVHVFNVLPNGLLIDVNGIHTEQEMLSQWEFRIRESDTAKKLTLAQPPHEMSKEILQGFTRYYGTDTERSVNRLGELGKLTPA